MRKFLEKKTRTFLLPFLICAALLFLAFAGTNLAFGDGGSPDLVVTDITWNPANPVTGNAVTFSAVVKNQGTGATPAGTIIGVSFWVDGTQVSWSDTDTTSLGSGASVTLTANSGPSGSPSWTATTGTHSVMAWVDDVSRISESNENNNQFSKNISMSNGGNGSPDLIVTDIFSNPASPSTGNAVTFSAVVKNQGTGVTPAGTIIGVSFFVDGAQVSWSDTDTTSLASGASVTLTANGGPSGSSSWTVTTGSHSVMAYVDDVNRITESNENNNQFSENISIGNGGSGSGSPDLIVSDIISNPASPLTGNAVTFGAVVKNQGTDATPAGTIIGVSFLVDGNQVSWSDTDTTSLAAGASVTLTANSGPSGSANWTATTGTHSVMAWVDDVSRISESDESNNKFTKNILIAPTPMPDLTVTDITYAPVSPISGDAVTFTATVKNQGNAAGAAGIVAFSINGTQVTKSANSTTSMAPGDSIQITATSAWTAVVGSPTVSATADSVNTTAESDETNNILSKTITISPKPGIDLTVTNISWVPVPLMAGSAVTFSAVVHNQGTIASPPGILAFKINGTQVAVSNNITTAINPGQDMTISANSTWSGAQGSYTLTATADSTNLMNETDKTNNSLSTTITVLGGRGCTMPYTRYESDDSAVATYGGGAKLYTDPTFIMSGSSVGAAAEASDQKYVGLPYNGAYVEYTIRPNEGGAGVNMRFTMPDSGTSGLQGSLDVYVNGSKVTTVNLDSYWSWQYFSGGGDPSDSGSMTQKGAAFRFDEVHFILPTALKPDDKIRIQKNNGDAYEYGVDFLEIEQVPGQIARPSGSFCPTDYGASTSSSDNTDAFNKCIAAAAKSGLANPVVYIPAGTWKLASMWVISADNSNPYQNRINNMTITGAGIWYTDIQFTGTTVGSGGVSLHFGGALDFSNMHLNSRLSSRYNENAVYKCFMDEFGQNSKIHDIWEQHFECGIWVGCYHQPYMIANGLQIYNDRIRDNLADGVNFCQGTSNSTVTNCSIRNCGDDGLAIWSANDFAGGAQQAVNNTFSFCTVENIWRASGVGIFGGSGHTVKNMIVKDNFMSAGLRVTTDFPGYRFENNTGITFADITIISCGTSWDCWSGELGAIDLKATGSAINNVTFTNIDIYNTQRDGVEFGGGSGFNNVNLNNVTINGTGLDGITTSKYTLPHPGEAIMSYVGSGTVTFSNLVMSNIAAPSPYYMIQPGFNLIIK